MTSALASRRPWRGRIGIGVAAIAALAAAAYWFSARGSSSGVTTYRFAEIESGSITDAVSSTGTLGAVGVVQLRSLVTGEVVEVLVDYNSEVSAGQLLARLDPESFEAEVVQAEADLAISKASLVSSRASVERAEADLRGGEATLIGSRLHVANAEINLEAMLRELERQRELFARNVVAPAALEKAQDAYKQAENQLRQVSAQLEGQLASQDSRLAGLSQAHAGIVTSEAQVQQREAQLNAALIELSRTEIRSPVSGTILERMIEPGQTVTTGGNATKLFTIAQNLQQMQVEVSVDEADIGSIVEGMPVTFSVDAYPGRGYAGVVRQVRLAPQTVQNVVTYTVIVSAQNADFSLLPGMTATARIILAEQTDALRIPNGALRYEPVGYEPESSGGGGSASGRGGGGFTGDRANQAASDQGVGGGRGGAARGGGGASSRDGQSDDRTARADGSQGGGGGRGGGGRGGGGNLLAAYVELGLSDSQREQIQQALASTQQQVASLRQSGASVEEIQQRLSEVTRDAVAAVLTPEQRQTFEATEAASPAATRTAAAGRAQSLSGSRGRGATVFVLDEDLTPQPVSVSIGITEGAFTELVSGDLVAGQEVITGSNEVQEIESPGGGGLRFLGF
jgi:HlyD family secretion protein